jgi:uncharacterized protein (TIGR02001 family)
MFRFLIASAIAAAGISAHPAFAQQQQPAEVEPDLTVTGGATLTSDYRFRGISLSDSDPAVQGTVNLNHKSGLYAGVWASSLEGFGAVGGASAEIDLYAGFRREVVEGVTIDAGLLYYVYPGAEGGGFDYFEPYANVSGTIGPVTAKVGLAYAWEQDTLGGNDNLYVFNDNTLAIPGTPLSLTTHVGYNTGDSGLAFGDDYLDWALGATATWRNLTLGLAYVGTDIDDAQAIRTGATPVIVDDTIVVSLTASF